MIAGAYTDAAGEHGLAAGFGDTGSVGIAGITLAGYEVAGEASAVRSREVIGEAAIEAGDPAA